MDKLEVIDVYTPTTVHWGGKMLLEQLKNDIARLEGKGINMVWLDIYNDYEDGGEPYIHVGTYIRRPITEKEIHDRELRKQNELIKKEEDERKLYQELKLKYGDV